MRRLLVFSAFATGVGAGCSGESYVVITVEAPPAIRDVSKLEVTRFGQDPPQVEMLPVLNFKLPFTFSISGLGEEGIADLGIHAISTDDFVVGTARTEVELSSSTATVRLETTDFVVNTSFEDDQALTEEADTVGRQIAATTLGDWTVAFGLGSSCVECDVYGRRFDSTGAPSTSGDAEGPVAFRISTKPSRRGAAAPAIAAAGLRKVVVWDFADIADGASGVACRGIDERGVETAAQLPVTFETAKGTDVAPLPNGNFVVTWLAQLTKEVHMRFVLPDCTATGLSVSVSKPEQDTPRGAHVASNATAILYAWILGDSVRLRAGTSEGELFPEFSIAPPPESTVEHVRVVAMGSGFGVALRIAAKDRTKPGTIVLYRTTATGELMPGMPTEVTNQSGSNTATGRIGFGLATRSDGATMIVWHQCADGGTSSCLNQLEIYGRLFHSDGSAASDPFVVPTTTNGDQRNPSVVALRDAFVVTWTDESKTAPDTSGLAVRARIIYPPL